jgi:phosphate/sulfate permease
MSETTKKAAIGLKRMGVLMWCVMAIVVVVFMHLAYTVTMGAPALTAMTLIAAMGGVDVWKQGGKSIND